MRQLPRSPSPYTFFRDKQIDSIICPSLQLTPTQFPACPFLTGCDFAESEKKWRVENSATISSRFPLLRGGNFYGLTFPIRAFLGFLWLCGQAARAHFFHAVKGQAAVQKLFFCSDSKVTAGPRSSGVFDTEKRSWHPWGWELITFLPAGDKDSWCSEKKVGSSSELGF